MYEKQWLERMTKRQTLPLSPEKFEDAKKYLLARGWRSEARIDKDCLSHQQLANYSPIVHWTEALIWQAHFDMQYNTPTRDGVVKGKTP